MTKETMAEYRFANHKEWKEAMQEAPSVKWIKNRDLSGSKSSSYIPIGIQEALADLFFREFDIVDTQIEVNGNQILAQVKINVLPDYPHAEHRTISGVAARVMTKAGNSLEYGARSAKNAAKSEALTDFSNIFGRNLNRDFANDFSYSKAKKTDPPKQTTDQKPQQTTEQTTKDTNLNQRNDATAKTA